MQVCLGALDKAMPVDAKRQFRTNTRTRGRNKRGQRARHYYTNKDEFALSFWTSL